MNQQPNSPHTQNRAWRRRCAAVLFWLVVWQAAAMRMDLPLFFPTPLEALRRFFELLLEGALFGPVLRSTARIMGGYLLSFAAALLLGAAAHRFAPVRALLEPLLLAVRTVPVVSFVILALICLPSRLLSVLISFLMVLPILTGAVIEGLDRLDPTLTDMATLFRVPPLRRLRCIDLPQLLPTLTAAARRAVGFAWKSGAAAEVIGIPAGSIGEKLQRAKVYLMTSDLFAWTLMIVLMSVLTEALVGALFKALTKSTRRLKIETGAPAAATTHPAAARFTQCPAASLTITGLCKSYDGASVLTDFTLTCPPGTRTALMAPSGAGKTTLLRLAEGLEQPDSGQITWQNGESDNNVCLCTLFQEDALVPGLSAIQNICLTAPHLTRAEALQALDRVGLAEDADRPVSEYSGGMKRRTALLRALLSEGSAVLLDEPFKGLDEESRKQTVQTVDALLAGRTLLLVTHDRRDAEDLSARIVTL